MDRLEILGIIPARSGSKSIKNKTIMSILGKPFMVYSIEHSLASKLIIRTIANTDSEYYVEVAREHDAEVPFLLPKEISSDLSLEIEFFMHMLDFIIREEEHIPEIYVQLRPTHPIRNIAQIDEMIQLLIDNEDFDSESIKPLFNFFFFNVK